MNLPFRKPEQAPIRIVVERERIVRLIAEVDNCRAQVNRAIEQLETGRAGKAAEILREIAGRLK